MVRIEELHSVMQIVVRKKIISACDLQMMVGKWWNHELELVATRVILRISSECVESHIGGCGC